MVSDIIRPAADALRAERSRLLADVNEMASDPDRQDELVAVMRDVRRIDRRLAELSEAEHQRELEAIVRDLAAVGHPVDENDVCLLCGEITPSHVRDLSRALNPTERAEHHDPTCSWRKAVEFVSAHPVSGGQP